MINTIYIENGVKNHPRTQTILARFDQARQISIDRYGEVFNRRAQNFRLQKLKPALILAQKHSGHILPAPNGFGIGGSKNFYFAHMANCLYDCRYCFLQGMYRSANYIIFVNFEDFDEQIDHLITQHPNEKVYFFLVTTVIPLPWKVSLVLLPISFRYLKSTHRLSLSSEQKVFRSNHLIKPHQWITA